MKMQEVILRAASGELSWIQAADILGVSPRTLRRWKHRLEERGSEGLLDRRCQRPGLRRIPLSELERILTLYREQYDGFNAHHFHEKLVERHAVKVSYTFVKEALQGAGLTRKRRSRGRHHKRRERKAHFGEMLHIDGSKHRWLALAPEQYQTLIVVLDDATGKILYAKLEEAEDTRSVLEALRATFSKHGLPMRLYSDRAGWAFHTPKAGGKVDKSKLTQVGRALHRLGVEHVAAYTPQARGRSERAFGTLQDRLVNELKAAGIATVADANRFIRQRFVLSFNRRFGHEPKDPQSVFVHLGHVDLDQILCVEHHRTVGKDNTVRCDSIFFQVEKQPGRRTMADREVIVRHHLEGTYSIWLGDQQLGVYTSTGRPKKRQPQLEAA